MIDIEIFCNTCESSSTFSFKEWPFEQTTVACKNCEALIGENQKQAMDGCINYYRLANHALQNPISPTQAKFAFHLRSSK